MNQLPSREDLLKAQEDLSCGELEWSMGCSGGLSDDTISVFHSLLTAALDRDVVMVPKEPTRDMYVAFDKASHEGKRYFEDIYRATIAASPYAQELSDA